MVTEGLCGLGQKTGDLPGIAEVHSIPASWHFLGGRWDCVLPTKLPPHLGSKRLTESKRRREDSGRESEGQERAKLGRESRGSSAVGTRILGLVPAP